MPEVPTTPGRYAVDESALAEDPTAAVADAVARAREARAAGDRDAAVALIEGTLRWGAWRRPSLWGERLALMDSPEDYAHIRQLWLDSPQRTHTHVSILRSVARAAAAAGEHEEARILLRRAIGIRQRARRRPRAVAGRLLRKARKAAPTRAVAPKAATMPFEVGAAEALADLDRELEALGVRAFLISGTLLGYLRDAQFISWDKDIDVGIFTEDIEPAVLERAFEGSSSFLVKRLDFNSDRLRINHINGVMIDVFPHYRDPDDPTRVWHDGTATRWWNTAFDLKQVEFLGRQVWVPDPADRYLDENYGDWRTPDPTFDVRKDAPNVEVTDPEYLATLDLFSELKSHTV